MKKYKYLVGSGCSFSEIEPIDAHREYEEVIDKKWMEYLGIKLDISQTYNMASGGSGNEFIKINFLYKMDELINKGINPSDIFVAIQWTGFERCDLFVSDEIPTIDGLAKDLQPNYIGNPRSIHPNKSFGWTFSGAHVGRDKKYERGTHQSRFNQEYVNRWYKYYYTHQGMWVNTLDNILFVQNFCKSHNIDYVFCTSWDNVTGQDNGYDKRINTLEQFNGFQFLWNMIDLDRFIFYPSNLPNMVLPIDSVYKQFIKERGDGLSNYGGMWQYMGERDGIDLDDRHPNSHGSKIWAEYIHNTMKDRKLL